MDNEFKINSDGKLSLEYGDILIKEYSIGEIMARHNVRPFFVFAQSNSGKTIIGSNCVLECVARKYSQIIYITQSYKVANNVFLRNNVLKQFVFNPNQFKTDRERKEEFVKFLSKLEHTLEQIGDQQKDYADTVKKYIQPLQQDMIRTAELDYCQKIKNDNPYVELLSVVFQDKHLEADKIFKSIYSQSTLLEFFNKVEGSLSALSQLFQQTQNLKVMYSGAEMSKSFAFAMWRNKIRDDYQTYKNIIQQKYKDIIIQVYKELMRDCPDEVQMFMQNQVDYPANTSQKQKVKDICSAIQSEPRFCVIFDDVSELLQDMLQETKQKYQGRSIKAYTEQFIKFMVNKGRHYGTFFCAVHATNVIPSTVRQLIGNFIIPPAVLDQFIKQTTSAQTDKPDIRAIASALGEYNKEHGTYYTLVYFQNPEESVDGCKFAFMQAEYNEKAEFNVAGYKANPYFYYLAQHQNDQEDSEDEDDEYEYTYEEESA